ncbi:MAG: MarR family winged helix-turn-helix transcriptional regulator [Vicinamibacterales bacterium]
MAKIEIAQPYLDAWRAVLNTQALVTRRADESLAAAGLPPRSWYDVLWALYRAPRRTLRMGELADSVVTISRSGLTRLVDRVEAAGLLRRQASAADRRGTEVVLTREGAAMLRRMWPVYAAEIRRSFVDVLSDQEAAAVRDALSEVHEHAREVTRPAAR